MTHIAPTVTRVFMSGCAWSGPGAWGSLLGPLITWSLSRARLSPWSATLWRSVRRKLDIFNFVNKPLPLRFLHMYNIFRENPELNKQKQNSNVIIDLKTDPKWFKKLLCAALFTEEEISNIRNIIKVKIYYLQSNMRRICGFLNFPSRATICIRRRD